MRRTHASARPTSRPSEDVVTHDERVPGASLRTGHDKRCGNVGGELFSRWSPSRDRQASKSSTRVPSRRRAPLRSSFALSPTSVGVVGRAAEIFRRYGVQRLRADGAQCRLSPGTVVGGGGHTVGRGTRPGVRGVVG